MMRSSFRALGAAVVLFGALEFAQAGGVVDPSQSVAGVSQLTLSEQWWQWAAGAPQSSSPLLDATGEFANVNNDGPVFFLAGNLNGGPSARTFSVPLGKPIFFPMVNAFDIEFQPAPTCPAHPADALKCAFDFIPGVAGATGLHATLDGQDLLGGGDGFGFRQTSTAFFVFDLQAGSLLEGVFGLPPGTYDMVSDGFWIALEGLAPGRHTLVFGGTIPELAPGVAPFTLEVTDIFVVPESGTLSLVLLGALVAVGRFRSRAAVSRRT